MWLKYFLIIDVLNYIFLNTNVFYTPMNSLHLEKSTETGLYVKMYTPKG